MQFSFCRDLMELYGQKIADLETQYASKVL